VKQNESVVDTTNSSSSIHPPVSMIDLVETASFPYDSFIVQRQESSVSCEKQQQRRRWQRFLAFVFASRNQSKGAPTLIASLTTCTSRSCQSLETGGQMDPTSDSEDDDSSSSDPFTQEACQENDSLHRKAPLNIESANLASTNGATAVSPVPTLSLTTSDAVANTNASIRDFIKESMRKAEEVVSKEKNYQKGLELYRHIARLADGLELLSSQEWIHICYMCTRYAMAIGDFETAYHFALKEMQYSLGSANASPGTSPMAPLQGDIAAATYIAMAERYHDLARICQYGLGDTPQALLYYQSALEMEQKCLQTCSAANSDDDDHASPLIRGDEIRRQIQETKKCIGRIQFALGNIDAALGML
jgi:tetratricopeptide (TPR) repeat protein